MHTAKQFTYRSLNYCNLGLIGYEEAWDLHKDCMESVRQKTSGDLLFLLEHPHTYTLGKTADKTNLIGDKNYLKEKKITVFEIDRGGDITYHGPGQIVGYPIINLTEWKQDTHLYLRSLEEVLIRVCRDFGLVADRNEKHTGVWLGNKKIAAIGIKVSRWITMHGFAFNVNTDLDYFNGIIPCGITDKDVTSLQQELKKEIDINDVMEKIIFHFKEVFSYNESNKVNLDELNLPLKVLNN